MRSSSSSAPTPTSTQRAAARFHARYVIDTKLGAADSALLLAALNGLAGPSPAASAAALRALLEAQAEHHLASLLPEKSGGWGTATPGRVSPAPASVERWRGNRATVSG